MTVSIIVLALALAQTPAGAGQPASDAALPTLTLEEALRQADEKNLDLKTAQARLDQAHEIHKKVWSGYLPQITLGASYTRNQYESTLSLPTATWIRDLGTPQAANGPANDPGKPVSTPPDSSNPPGSPSQYVAYPANFETFVVQKQDQLGAQLQVSQALLVPTLWPAISNSYLQEKTAELSTANARVEILFGVAQAYYGAVGLKEALAVQNQLLDNARAHERDAAVRVQAGAAPKITLIRAQIDRARVEQDVRRAQSALDSARVALATLIDRPDPRFDVVHPAEPPVPASPGQLEQTAVDKRLDLAAAKESTAVARKTADTTWYSYAPNVFLKGAYQLANTKGFGDSYGSWALTLALSWTIWDGGLRESQVRENDAKAREADATERAAIARARADVRSALLDLESAQANRVKAEEQARLARENMQLVNVNFQSGVATPLDVADATTQLGNAELGKVAETLNAQLAVLKLMKVSGEYNPR